MTNLDKEAEEPLDPKIEHIRKRMIRLLFISIAIMMVGLMAVLFAIVYKINTGDKNESGDEARSVIPGEQQGERSFPRKPRKLAADIKVDIPEGAVISSTKIMRGRMLFEIELADESVQYWIVDLHSGEVISRIVIQ